MANVDPIQKHKAEKEQGRVRYVEKGAGEERERELGWCCSVRMAEVCQISGMRFSVGWFDFLNSSHSFQSYCLFKVLPPPVRVSFVFVFCLFKFFNFLF